MPIRPALELEEALASYATAPTPELAAAIAQIGREALADFKHPVVASDAEFHAAWLEAVKLPAARTWCIDVLHDRLQAGALEQRLAALRAITGDPRTQALA